MSERRVRVDLRERGYDVIVGRGTLGTLAPTVRSLVGDKASRVFVVIDTGVPGVVSHALLGELAAQGLAVTSAELTPSESMKNLETVRALLMLVAGSGHTRVDPIVALGGGVVGDIAGFVAASYQRGVPVVQCPTTLLSMVDASVGGKTGVNLSVPDGAGGTNLYKNMVGAFHQATVVCADVGVLDSLDERQRRCGLAECVKHAMICATAGGGAQGDLLDWTLEHLGAIRSFEGGAIEALVARNVALKASVVMGDERESPDAKAGGRMLLNFGHTFGHAIETLPGLGEDGGPLYHGEAVALGMVAACAAGAAMGLCAPQVGDELKSMLATIGLPVSVSGLADDDELIARMGHDKKAAGGSLRVILPTGRGKCAIVDDADRSVLVAGLGAIRG